MTPTPAFHLALAMQSYRNEKFAELIKRAGVPVDAARRARSGAHGRPTRAEHHLKLCAVLGIDPVDGRPIAVRKPLPLLASFFAAGVKGNRMLNGHTLRRAAKLMAISPAVLSRIENGDTRSFDGMLAACRYIGAHPFDYLDSRETPRETKPHQGVAA